MSQKSFILEFPNILTYTTCNTLIDWANLGEGKTVEASRDTRRDVQKWLPQDNELWVFIQNAKRAMRED